MAISESLKNGKSIIQDNLVSLIPSKGAFNIEGRRLSYLTHDPQRQWLFEVIISNIENLIPKFNINEDDIIIRCKTISIPNITFDVYESNFLGFKKAIPIKKNNTNTVVTEIEEFEDQKVHKLLYNWSNLIFHQNPMMHFSNNSDVFLQERNKYTRNIILKMYKLNGQRLDYTIKFMNAWPSKVNDTQLGYEQDGQVKFNVEWNFDYWIME